MIPQLPPAGQVCTFTGHRDMTSREMETVLPALTFAIEQMLERGITAFLVGGAIGFDTLAAIQLLNLRQIHPQIRLYLAIPCKGQDAKWNSAQQSLYARIRRDADGEFLLAERYYRGCMQRRNAFMVENSSHLIAYVKRSTGGSAQTLALAMRQGLSVQNLAETPPPLRFVGEQGTLDLF